ncbi:hypothetical protein AAZX31_10G132400 [Glycine max]
MSDGNEGNAGRKTQRLCFIFPLHVLLFNFFHSMFIVSSKATFFFPTTVRRRCLGVVVLQMPDGNDGDAERKNQRRYLGAVVLQMPDRNDGDVKRKTQRLKIDQ